MNGWYFKRKSCVLATFPSIEKEHFDTGLGNKKSAINKNVKKRKIIRYFPKGTGTAPARTLLCLGIHAGVQFSARTVTTKIQKGKGT